MPTSPKRKRVVKKLIRVQPIPNDTSFNSHVNDGSEINTEPSKIDVTTRRIRRRLKIKKKKKLIVHHDTIENTSDIDYVEHVKQATMSRRKIVITRKRILPNINKSKNIQLLSDAMPSSTIERKIQSTLDKSFSEILDHTAYDNKFFTDTVDNDVDENYEDIDNDDVETDVNFDEIENEDEETDDEYDDYQNYDNEDYDYDISENDENFGGEINESRTNSSAVLSSTTYEKHEDYKNSLEPEVEDDERNSEYSEGGSFQNENIISTNNNTNGEYLSVPSEDVFDINSPPSFQEIPEYEPSFPELTESLDAPELLLKTTVLSSTELLTRTVTESRLRTYTFVITRVSGNEQIITSTTEVKPQIKTSILTEPQIKYTTLTLLNLDATKTLTDFENTLIPTLDNPQSQLLNQENGSRNFNEEARYNLATRVMSNGVEVIVAGDKKSSLGEHDFKRLLSTGIQKPVTLKPSTLTDHMVMMLPQEESNIESLTSNLYPNQFVTKTCLTTFTYLTTYLEGSTTTVSSHEQVISNVATEERNTGKILPTPAMGVTLTQFPNLSVGVFHTTYTYLNTLLDGEQPLVLSSEHTVTNTVTAPDDYLSLLKPSEMISAMKDTNTYYSTIGLEKTLYEGDKTSIISTREVVTQVVITESVPPRATSVMTSYIALDMEENLSSISSYSTTDVVKTYFVTYTYYNTLIENGKEVVKMNISTSSDVVTEQLYLLPKKTSNSIVKDTTSLVENNTTEKMNISDEQDKLQIISTKSYLTTFTYFTTLLQEKNKETPTVVSSRTKVIENVVTEVVNPKLLGESYLNAIRKSIDGGHSRVITLATLLDGQQLELTAFAVDSTKKIVPTKTLSIEKTEIPELKIRSDTSVESSSPSIITGSTIVFIDDDPFAQLADTPTLFTSSKLHTLDVKNSLGSLLSSEIIDGTKIPLTSNKSKRSTRSKIKNNYDNISPTKTKSATNKIKTRVPVQKPTKIVQENEQGPLANKIDKLGSSESDLLGLGSININSLQALTPVLNAMAGLISTNLKTNRRHDVNVTTASTTTSKPNSIRKADGISAYDAQNRSPIYIPVGGLADDFEIAESQNIATFDWIDPPSEEQVSGASLLNGGIPISPGEIITANSDVIVGKPGRIGPRIPSIPLHHVTSDNEIPIGMKPPPVPKNAWRNKNHEYRHIPVSNVKRNKPVANVVHSPNKDDYFGPPPLLPETIQNQQYDRKNHLQPPRGIIGPNYGTQFNRYEIPINKQISAQSNNNYEPGYKLDEPNREHQFQNLQESIQQNYNSMAEHSFPLYAQSHFAVGPGMPMNNFNIKPSIINEPITLPEVIERSTGQPLLVNIQPSQVAFVSIPYNRTTALIYGGSTEPHRNGQYFDDPSPYPEPEFSGIEFNNGIPHVASVYQGEPVDQKQVNGFIKVENQLINVDPVTSENQNIQVNIRPSRPQISNGDHVAFGNDHEISLNVPPISFGLMHQGDDFNAHIINHSNNDFKHSATPHKILKDERIPNVHIVKDKYPIPFPSAVNNMNQQTFINEVEKPEFHSTDYEGNIHSIVLQNTIPHNNFKVNDISEDKTLRRPEQVSNQQNIIKLQVVTENPSIPKRNIWYQKPQIADFPNPELVQYMTPPPFVQHTATKHPHSRIPQNKRPTMSSASVPSLLNNQHNTPLNPNYAPPYPSPHKYDRPTHFLQTNEIQNRFPEYHSQFKHHFNSTTYSSIDPDVGYHRDDDLENEDGEVVQESNSRPLLPGEIPTEVLKAQNNRYNSDSASNNTIRFPADDLEPPHNTKFNIQIPVITQNPRPFVTSKPDNRRPVYKAETQNGAQVTPFDSNVIGFDRFSSTERNIKNGHNTYNSNSTTPNVSKGTSNGFVVVGSQFTNNPHSQKTLVSGTQFSQQNSRNKSSITKFDQEYNSSGSNIVAYDESKNPQSNNRIFGSKIQQSIPISYPTTTTSNGQKPVLIFIDETGGNKKDFFHINQKQSGKDTYKNVRPSVTSLPIDIPTFNPQEPHSNIIPVDTQTEEAFVLQSNGFYSNGNVHTTTEEPIKNIRRPIPESTTSEDLVTSDLNTGEITLPDKSSTIISDMEIMKPPPSVKPLDTEIQPPTLITETPIGEIKETPIKNRDDFIKINIKSSTEKSFLPNFLEELVPPPINTADEEVVGMRPPPIISNTPQKTTTKPVVPMQTDVTRIKSVPESSSTTERYKYTRTRRPFTRRPNYKMSTTIPPTTRRQPVYTFYNTNIRNRTKASPTQFETEQNIIKPSPSMKTKPSLEVIIGKPNLNFGESDEAPSTTNYVEIIEKGQGVELSASEISVHVPAVEKTASFKKDMSDLLALESGIPTPNFDMHSSPSTTDLITKAVHHAGNEIKIIDDPTSASTTNRKPSPTYELRTPVSTKYITHMKTATVTITKTTVVKSQGMKPSTSTILLTTTEKRTIIDTVTEVHTLVKPTNIIETVTTTIQQGNSLYPPEVYGSPYPSIQVKPSVVMPNPSTASPVFDIASNDSDEDLEDFIIHETDPPMTDREKDQIDSNESILVVISDKNTKNIIPVPNNSYEIQERDEMIATNKVNNVLLGGILIANHPGPSGEKEGKAKDRCDPECKPSKNELCQKLDGIMRCVCRPGFARMFPDRPCLPTYTYELNITLERIGKDTLHFFDDLRNSNSTEFNKFAQATREGLNRMVMQSDLRDIFHGVKVHSFEPSPKGIVSKFYLQLSDNIADDRLTDIFQKYLRNNNHSLGGTDIFASASDVLKAEDFDECSFAAFNDCSENAQCFNLRGTYTCSCKEGFSDLSENMVYPGRLCSAEQVGCERCSYHGTCYSRGGNEVLCECFQWYTGDSCQINLKVLLIALATLGIILFILLLVCIFSACFKRKTKNARLPSGMRFMPQRTTNCGSENTLDRRAMIQDTSSEDSRSETTETVPYIQEQTKKPKTAMKKFSKVSMQISEDVEHGDNNVSFMEQKDRSLTVMIPRAKYHPASATSPLMNYTTFDARKPSVPSTTNETKLLSYLDAGPTPNKSEPSRKLSKTPSDSIVEEKPNSRKTSGALISAGFEVSATVVNNMGTLGTTCGTEADRSENATLIQRISTDLLSSTGTRSQFNTLRKSLIDEDLENSSHWLDMVPRVMTVSEARSYEETTIPPPMKSFRTDYDSKPSSQQPNDEANTMAERDLGSTFLLPHTHLYNPDRGSDISGFESL